jgi:hypothetical protein
MLRRIVSYTKVARQPPFVANTVAPFVARSMSSLSYKKPANIDASKSNASSSADSVQSSAPIHDSRYYEKYTFEKDFLTPASKNIYAVPEGGFVEVDPVQLDKFLPEGMCGPVEDGLELNNTAKKGQPVWMIRESTKLVCRIIDEYDAHLHSKNKSSDKEPVIHEVIHPRRVHVPHLTDREEWTDNVIKVTRYGKDLVNASTEKLQGASNYIRIHKKEDCVVDSAMEQIKHEIKAEGEKTGNKSLEFPNKVMLMGERGVGKSTVLTQAVLHARKNGWLVVHIPRGWEQSCEGGYVEPAAVPLPDQIVSNGDLDILTSMKPVLKPSVRNPLYYAAHSQLVDGQVPEKIAQQAPEDRKEQVFDNIFQSAVALRGLYRAHAAELKNIPLSYSNSNDNTAHYLSLKNQINNVPVTGDMGTAAANGSVFSSIDAFELVREQFLASQEKVMSAPGRTNFNFMQIRELVEGEDNFREQDTLDSDILLSSNGSASDGGKKGFDMKTFQFKTLEDLLLFGMAVRSTAGSAFMHIIEELKRVKSHKVMIAVDQYNTFDAPSSYSWNMKRIMGRDLCVPRALYGISKKRAVNDSGFTLANGMMLCATSHTHEEGSAINYYNAIKSIPLAVRLPSFNQVEYFSFMRYYASVPSKMTEFVPLSQLLTYRTLCNSNPYEVRLNCFLYFAASGMNSNIDTQSFHYLVPNPSDDAALAEEKRTKLRELEQKFTEFKKSFKGINN